jgi:hypothetical protein
MDAAVGSLEALLALADAQEKDGLGDAPWPPHYRKAPGEPDRVQPSRKKQLIPIRVVAKAEKLDEAQAWLERWKLRHPEAAQHLTIEDVLIDSMRGRSTTWTRIRVHLRHVPEALRPDPEPPDPDYDGWSRPKRRKPIVED